jgi:hypothetical protein
VTKLTGRARQGAQRRRDRPRRAEDILRKAQKAGDVRSDLDCGIRASEFMAFAKGATGMWRLDRTISLVGLREVNIDVLTGDLSHR